MGSGNSRLGPPRHRPDGRPRLGLASFLCGGASSSAASQENEPSGIPLIQAGLHDSVLVDNYQSSAKNLPLNFSSENSSSSSTDEHLWSSLSSSCGLKDGSAELRITETNDVGKYFSESRELVPCLENASSGLDMTHPERTSDLAGTSTQQEHVEQLVANVATTISPVPVANASMNGSYSLTSPMRFSSHVSQLEPSDLRANEDLSTENHRSNVLGIHNFDSASFSAVSTTSASWHLSGEESSLEATPSGSAFLSPPGERRDGTILHVDVESISSNILPSDSGEISNHETRRSSRRLFWDAFSRRSSRRTNDYAAVFLTTEDTDDLGSHDRSLLDISEEFFGDDSIYLRRRRHGLNGRSWHSRTEIRERFRNVFDDDSGQTPFCPSGLHPGGTCSCDSLIMAVESSTRASISRIVMLAEALFEVLDEIHHQPISLSLSMVSLPAPESIVNSLPLKRHAKLDLVGSVDEVAQCYICLAEYEEGDNIRVLPCRHEYHVLCVDKWLKEIHGVCPLCRRDVCEGTTEGSTSNL